MDSPTYTRRRRRATQRLGSAALTDWLGRKVVLLAVYRDLDHAERDAGRVRAGGTEARVVLDVFGLGGPACLFVLYAPHGREAARASRILRAADRPSNRREVRRSRRAGVAGA